MWFYAVFFGVGDRRVPGEFNPLASRRNCFVWEMLPPVQPQRLGNGGGNKKHFLGIGWFCCRSCSCIIAFVCWVHFSILGFVEGIFFFKGPLLQGLKYSFFFFGEVVGKQNQGWDSGSD